MKNYYLVLDIGNSTISFAKVHSETNKIIKDSIGYIKHALASYTQLIKTNIEAKKIIISSVSPNKYNMLFKQLIKYYPIKDIVFLNEYAYMLGVFSSKNIAINNIGMDIICKTYYTAKENINNVLILDLGTATVFQLSKGSEIKKAAITVGLSGSFKALYSDAYMINEVESKHTSNNIMSNEPDLAICSGVYWGYVEMVNNLINKVLTEEDIHNIYVTGGNYSKICKNINFQHIYEPYMVLKGIVLIYKNLQNMIKGK